MWSNLLPTRVAAHRHLVASTGHECMSKFYRFSPSFLNQNINFRFIIYSEYNCHLGLNMLKLDDLLIITLVLCEVQ